MMVQAVLTFSLLVAFTTSAAAALCLQMDHGAAAAGMSSVSADLSAPTGSPLTKACCYQQSGTPDAVTATQRALPIEQSAALSTLKAPLRAFDAGQPPPGMFVPALEKRDHLTPSLTALSISRT
ncbi:hypothetical protein [uncultured Arthrobacter sp.]|uniref:hypothetical protein n=1 Tax=uncultured Arthrobacter sp. TaxID=114050 RepID=UPI00262973C4|nr:hypothetical protein [uncultured Arthrobacter sp.]